MVASTACYWFGLNLLIMIAPYWVQDLLGLPESQVSVVMGPFTCDFADGAFSCPQRLGGESPVAGYDATLRYQVGVNGTWSGRDAMNGEQRMDIECDGTACGALAAFYSTTFPCFYTVAFTADHR